MSRLDYAPKLKEIEITDIKKGLGVFTPKPDKPVSFDALKETLKKAGYTLDTAEIIILGTLKRDEKGWWIVAELSGQRFALDGAEVGKLLAEAASEMRVEITGDWKTISAVAVSREVVTPRAVKKIESAPKAMAAKVAQALSGKARSAKHRGRCIMQMARCSSGAPHRTQVKSSAVAMVVLLAPACCAISM